MQNPWEYSGAQPQLHPVTPTGKLPSCLAELPTSFPAGHSTSKHPKFLFPAPSSFWHRLTHPRPCTVHRQKVFAQALHGKREQGKFHAGASGAASCRSKHFAGESLGSTAGKAGNDGSHASTSGTARGEMEGELRSSRCAGAPSHPSSTRSCSGWNSCSCWNSRSGHTQRATGTAPGAVFPGEEVFLWDLSLRLSGGDRRVSAPWICSPAGCGCATPQQPSTACGSILFHGDTGESLLQPCRQHPARQETRDTKPSLSPRSPAPVPKPASHPRHPGTAHSRFHGSGNIHPCGSAPFPGVNPSCPGRRAGLPRHGDVCCLFLFKAR